MKKVGISSYVWVQKMLNKSQSEQPYEKIQML